MSPITVASPDHTKTARKWNSILSPDHRRSQSLNSMHKSPAVDAMRSTMSLSTLKSRDDEQASIITAYSYPEAVILEEDASEQGSPARSVNSRQSFNTSPAPPTRPKPAPRLWQEAASPVTSLQGLETVIAPTSATSSPQDSTPTAVLTGPVPPSPRALVSKFSTWREKSFAGRRKGSIPDLELGFRKPFSPTSPSLPPIQSARTPNTVVTLGSITPKPVQDVAAPVDESPWAALRTPEWHESDPKRASSMLLPSNQAPIVIPLMPTRMPPVAPPPIDTTMASCKDEERPPRPPPKSPRTLLRAFPIPKSAAVSPGRHTANSSINSISPVETPSTAATTWSPMLSSSLPTAVPIPLANPFSKSASRNPIASSFEEQVSFALALPSDIRHGRSVSHAEQNPPRSSSYTVTKHRRMVSETSSVMNRGRPTKRGSRTSTAKIPKPAFVKGRFESLPHGIPRNQANQLPTEELHGLRREAEDVASEYSILSQKQIVSLIQEQRLLDESCDQLQHTIAALKEARKATYLSLKLYLDGPSTEPALREYTLKQSKTLLSLDLQIDEWQEKLDVISDRKTAAQAKVFEHMAAILTTVNVTGDVARRADQHTPPRSPERVIRRSLAAESPCHEEHDTISMTRGDVESITIYADSGVASLLRSIEEELRVIDDANYSEADEAIMI